MIGSSPELLAIPRLSKSLQPDRPKQSKRPSRISSNGHRSSAITPDNSVCATCPTPPKRCRRDLGRDPATSGNGIVANFSEIYRDILADHRKWLAGFSKHAAQWERRLRIQPEAAIVEACVRSYLAGYVKSVEPAEDLASGGPDFRCRRGGRIFYVESTCLTIDAVTNATKLSPSATGQAANYGTLTDLVKRECTNKTAQLSSRKDAPGLLAIGTLHFQASAQCIAERHVEAILTSTPFIACDFDPAAGEAVDDPYQAVNLRNSAFVKPPLADSIDAFEHARQSISGVLICGFGCIPPRILGALHPDSARPFDPDLLPQTRFCRLKHDAFAGREFTTEWIGGNSNLHRGLDLSGWR